MVPSASIPAVRQNRSKLTETASQALSTAPIPVGGKAVNGVIAFFMALLSFRGISTPSLPAQGEQRRSSYFNIPRGNSRRHSISVIRPVIAEPDFRPGLKHLVVRLSETIIGNIVSKKWTVLLVAPSAKSLPT